MSVGSGFSFRHFLGATTILSLLSHRCWAHQLNELLEITKLRQAVIIYSFSLGFNPFLSNITSPLNARFFPTPFIVVRTNIDQRVTQYILYVFNSFPKIIGRTNIIPCSEIGVIYKVSSSHSNTDGFLTF